MKLPEKDIKYLRKRTSRFLRVIVVIVFSIIIGKNLIMASANFFLSAQFGKTLGLSFFEVINKWIEGISTSENYSGAFLKAIGRWETGLLQLTVALIVSLLFVFWLQQIRREKRILQFIEEHSNCEPAGSDYRASRSA